MVSYRVDTVPPDNDTRRKLLAFVKAMGAEMLVVPGSTDLLDFDTLAEEYGINVVLLGDVATATRMAKSLEGKTKRLGVGLDASADRAALARVGNRLQYLALGRPALTADFFHELNRLNIRPLVMTLDTTGVVTVARRSVRGGRRVRSRRAAGVRRALHRVLAARVRSGAICRDAARKERRCRRGRSQGDRRGAAEDPRGDSGQAVRGAEEARGSCSSSRASTGMSHDTIPHTNVMLEEMGKITGRVDDRVQQRSQQSEVSEDQGIRRRLPEQHRRRVRCRSGGARRARAVRARRRRARRHPRHAVGVAQLGRVRAR